MVVAPPDQTSFNASNQSGQPWASGFAGRDGNDGLVLSSGKDFETSSQSLAGKSGNCVVGNLGLSDSDPSISPTIECASTMSKVVSYEAVEEEEEGIEKDGVRKFENLSVDVKEKDEIAKNESKSEVNRAEESKKGSELDDDEKRYQVLVEEEFVKLITSESVNVVDKTSPYIEELDDGDFELSRKGTKVEIVEKEEEKIHKESSDGEAVVINMSESGKELVEMIFGIKKQGGQLLDGSDESSVLSNQLDKIDGQMVTDSDDEGEEERIDTEALAAFLKEVTGGGSSEGGKLSLLQSAATRRNRSNVFPNPQVEMGGEDESNLSEEERHKLENLQSICVKYLRLVHRLGQSVEDSIAAQVLYRLSLLSGRRSGLGAAKKIAKESEAEGKEDLRFSLNILVLGKSGVGKSATINSILGGDQNVSSVDAFGPSTNSVKKISGIVNGVEITIIDTPGLTSYAMDQSANSKMLSSVKKVIKTCPPDVVLYVDRLDAQNRGLNNMPLLKTITNSLGSSIWENAIVTLTHAASAPPDGPSGTSLSYDVFVAQCSHIVQQSIGQAVGDLRFINPNLMNPVSLVENHPFCRKNREGVKVLPNGQTWRPKLLLLCYSIKVLSEANSLLKPREPLLDNRKHFWSRVRSLPLPNLLSWLLQSRAHPKLLGEDSIDSDIEIDDVCDLEQEYGEDDDEYDQLPPFKPLPKKQLDKLSKEHREAYFDEYHYRVKLLQKKQWREGLRKMREMKRNGKKKVEEEEEEEDTPPPASIPGLLADIVMPRSFDSDDSAYRYRSYEATSDSQLLIKSVPDSQGWDHDVGFNRIHAEHNLAIANRFPASVSVQMTKDKKDFNILLNSSACAKYGDNVSTMGEFLVHGSEQLMYLLKGETKFKNSKTKKNETTLGGLLSYMDGKIAKGVNLEKQIALGKRSVLVANGGTARSTGDSTAYEANLEIRLREADFPIGENQSALGLSLTKSKDDFTVTGNLRSQVSIGRQTKLAASVSLDSKKTGHINIRTSSSDSSQIAFMAILPIIMAIYKRIF